MNASEFMEWVKTKLTYAETSDRMTIVAPMQSLMVKYVEKHLSGSRPSETNFTFVRLNPMSVTALNIATKDQPHIIRPYSSPT